MRVVLTALAFIAALCAPVSAQTPFSSKVLSATISGAGQYVTVYGILGAASCTTRVNGTFSGTVGFQGSADNSNFSSVTSFPDPGANTSGSQTTTVIGQWTSPTPSMQAFRAGFASWSSGSATLTIACSTAPAVHP